MEHFVTLFDSLFLPQGLALHMSMERHVKNYTLWVLCMDNEVHEALVLLNLPNVRLLQLSKLETPELLAVKSTRSKGEYCWTLTPFAPRFVFEADPVVARVTYIDADIWFRKDPEPIFKEFGASGKHVLITDHAYAPEYDLSELSGQYCVQFLIFTRSGGEKVRKWWEDRCVEWCFARFEDNKFGDQKYLDNWPIKFPDSVYILTNKELIMAPWNAIRFPYGNSVIWHFHSLRITIFSKKSFLAVYGIHLLPKCTRDYVYQPYLNDLRAAIKEMTNIGVALKSQKAFSLLDYLKMYLRILVARLWLFTPSFITRL